MSSPIQYFLVNDNNNNFFCANILENQAQWRDKNQGINQSHNRNIQCEQETISYQERASALMTPGAPHNEASEVEHKQRRLHISSQIRLVKVCLRTQILQRRPGRYAQMTEMHDL